LLLINTTELQTTVSTAMHMLTHTRQNKHSTAAAIQKTKCDKKIVNAFKKYFYACRLNGR